MTQDLDPAVSADACQTMDQVRVEIDRLDRALVRLMAARQGYIEAAGRIKAEKSEVRLPWRIEDVVAKVLRSAEREGLSKRIAEPVWRTLIECSIAHEHDKWDEVHGERSENSQ
ncbi:MAG: chorismate mutase [Pseudomonadota bacterium]